MIRLPFRLGWRRGEPPAAPAPAPLAGWMLGDEPTRDGGRRGGDGPTGAARRILSLHLPRFAMERRLLELARVGARPPDGPFALATGGRHGPVVHAVDPAAEAGGVRAGARVADARALCPSLRVEEADARGDDMALLRLAVWARRWCPWTAPDGTDGLMLDVTGSTHLWGGEDGLMRDVAERLGALGFSAAVATAPTPGAAWALARWGGDRESCPPEALAARMAPLPVAALRLRADAVRVLDRLGLRTVGQVMATPRPSLARRFADARPWADPVLRLDQMLGRVPEPIPCPDEPPRFAVQAALPGPVLDPSPHLPALARELCAALGAEGHGARRLLLTLYRSDGGTSAVEAAAARATRDPVHLARLLEGRLDRLDPGPGFDLVTLGAPVAEPLPARQPGPDGEADDGGDGARLVDRLAARFGPKALLMPGFRGPHLSEPGGDWLPALGATPLAPPLVPHRPVRLLDPPEEARVVYALPEGPPAQFAWRGGTHRVARVAGPERIAPEWWRDRPGARLRDYYRVEDGSGRRFWIFREGVVGDGLGGAPRWFVQGAFE